MLLNFNFLSAQTESNIKEIVKCTFLNSTTQQSCYTSNGKFKCDGTDNCVVDVIGISGFKFDWKSSCDGYAYTVMDGANENVEFICAPGSEVTPE